MIEKQEKRLLFLEALEAAGVDNWSGYGFAWEIYADMLKEAGYEDDED